MNENTNNVGQKEELANILNEKRDWQDADKVKPAPGQLVVIRLTDPDQICYEDDTRVYHVEDILIAQWKVDHWRIEPPFHKYNYSPLTVRYRVKPNAIVTHWAVPDEGEIDAWHNKMSYFHKYKDLAIIVDPEREEAVYKAILWGAAFIEEVASTTKDKEYREELKEHYQTLKDLQYSIDQAAPPEVRGEH